MAQITLKGTPIHTNGELPKVGSQSPDFKLTKTDLSDVSLADFAGKRVVLNVFPSVDTPVCATSVRKFNQQVSSFKDTVVLCVSRDLPFALKRFCGAEGLESVIPASSFRGEKFGSDFGVTITDGALAGLYSRCVIVLDAAGQVLYTEQVPEIAQEPNYDAVAKVLQ